MAGSTDPRPAAVGLTGIELEDTGAQIAAGKPAPLDLVRGLCLQLQVWKGPQQVLMVLTGT